MKIPSFVPALLVFPMAVLVACSDAPSAPEAPESTPSAATPAPSVPDASTTSPEAAAPAERDAGARAPSLDTTKLWRICSVRGMISPGGEVFRLSLENGTLTIWNLDSAGKVTNDYAIGHLDTTTRVFLGDQRWSYTDKDGVSHDHRPDSLRLTFSADWTRFQGMGESTYPYPVPWSGGIEDGSFGCGSE